MTSHATHQHAHAGHHSGHDAHAHHDLGSLNAMAATEDGVEGKKKDGGSSVVLKKIPTQGVGCSNTLTFGAPCLTIIEPQFSRA